MPLADLTDRYYLFPKPIAEQILATSASHTSQDFLTYAGQLTEALATFMGNFANSIYRALSLEKEDNGMETFLQSVDEKVSFGRRIEGLGKFRKLLTGVTTPEGEALRTILTSKDIPEPCAQFVGAVKNMEQGRRSYRIPSEGILQYVEDCARRGGSGKKDLLDFMFAVVMVRNAISHREGDDDPGRGNAWFVHDDAFRSAVRHWLEPGLLSLFQWDLLDQFLIAYENVVLLKQGPDGWAVERKQIAAPPVLVQSWLSLPTGQSASLQPGMCVIARRPEARSTRLEYVVPFVAFPAPRRSVEDLKTTHIHEYFSKITKVGLLDARSREELVDHASQIGLDAHAASSCAQGARDWLENHADDAPHDLASGQAVTPRDTKALAGFEPRQLGRGLYARRKDWLLREYLPNRYAVSPAILSGDTDLTVVTAAALLVGLLREGKVCVISAESMPDLDTASPRSEMVQQALFRLADSKTEGEIRGLLEEFRRRGERMPEHVWRLCALSVSLHKDQGRTTPSAGQRLDELLAQLRPLRADYTSSTSPEAAHLPEGVSIDFNLLGEQITETSSVELLKRVCTLVKRAGALPERVEFSKRRYVINGTPTHVDGSTPFAAPLSLAPGCFIETDMQGDQILDAAATIARVAGLDFESPGFEAMHIVHSGPSNSPAYRGSLVVEYENPDGEKSVVSGDSVRELFEDLLRQLTSSGLVNNVALPFAVGRMRVLIDMEPYHLNGKRFYNAVEHQGYYMETNASRANGISYAERLLQEAGCTVLSADDERERVNLDLDVRGHRVSGHDVPTFFAKFVRQLLEDGLLTVDMLPVLPSPYSQRYLIATAPKGSTGKPFYAPREVTAAGQTVFVECSFSRKHALVIAQTLLGELTEASAGGKRLTSEILNRDA